MNHYCEIRADREFDVFPGSYFAVAVLADGAVLPETQGRDEFTFAASLPAGKRVAGFGRRRTYFPPDGNPAGKTLEAAPSLAFSWEEPRDLAFRLTTNIFLDQGLIARHLTLRLATDGAPARAIPLSNPSVRIDWPGRGTFVVSVGPV
jgi:hypothetical protein